MKHKTATKSPGAGGERAKARSQQREVRMLERALQTAAEEAYQSEVEDTEMTECVIGEGGTHQSKADWIEDRIKSWKHPND